MATWKVLNEEETVLWENWLAGRPDNIQKLAREFPPWKLFKLNANRVCVQSYGEEDDGSLSLRVSVDGRFGVVTMERTVFGIKPEDLTECDLPADDEPVGCIGMTAKESVEMMKTGDRSVMEFRGLTTKFKTFGQIKATL